MNIYFDLENFPSFNLRELGSIVLCLERKTPIGLIRLSDKSNDPLPLAHRVDNVLKTVQSVVQLELCDRSNLTAMDIFYFENAYPGLSCIGKPSDEYRWSIVDEKLRSLFRERFPSVTLIDAPGVQTPDYSLGRCLSMFGSERNQHLYFEQAVETSEVWKKLNLGQRLSENEVRDLSSSVCDLRVGIDRLIELLKGNQEVVARYAALLLGSAAVKKEVAAEALAELFFLENTLNGDLLIEVVQSLTDLGVVTEMVAAALVQGLQHKTDAGVRLESVKALDLLEIEGTDVVIELIRTLADQDVDIVETVEGVLENFNLTADEIEDELMIHIQSDISDSREAACRLLLSAYGNSKQRLSKALISKYESVDLIRKKINILLAISYLSDGSESTVKFFLGCLGSFRDLNATLVKIFKELRPQFVCVENQLTDNLIYEGPLLESSLIILHELGISNARVEKFLNEEAANPIVIRTLSYKRAPVTPLNELLRRGLNLAVGGASPTGRGLYKSPRHQ